MCWNVAAALAGGLGNARTMDNITAEVWGKRLMFVSDANVQRLVA